MRKLIEFLGGFVFAIIDACVHAMTPQALPSPILTTPEPAPTPAPIETIPTPPVVMETEPAKPIEVPRYRWDTQEHARHSVRVICDEKGLSLYQKNVITACIMQESQFYNYLPNGNPCINKNYSKTTPGKLLSTDWGICQINDTKGWHIGPGLAFPSVEYLLAHPEEAVRYMIRMYTAGKLGQWVSYSSGAYLKYMPQ